MRLRGSAVVAVLAFVAVAALLVGCISAIPLEDQRWIRARSEHFEVSSSAPPGVTVRLVRDLERFRAELVRSEILTEGDAARARARVVLFGDAATFAGFRRRAEIQGYMTAAHDGPLLVVNGEPYERAVTVAFHEFVHLAEHASGAGGRPPWYREGLAEFLSTMRFVGGDVEIGRPAIARKRWLERGNPLPLRRLLTARDVLGFGDSELQTFYAQSWALVHFLEQGHLVGAPDRSDLLRAYLERSSSGESEDTAFEAAFGQTPEEFEVEFLRYLAAGRISWTRLPAGSATREVETRPIAVAERFELLGDLALRLGEERHGRAETLYRRALAADPGSQYVQASLALVLAHRGDPEAEQWLARLAASEVRDAGILGRMADAHRVRARRTDDDAEACQTAARFYERSLELAPERVASLYGWARCLGRNSEELERSIALLERAHESAPFLAAVSLALAKRRAALGELDQARRWVRVASRAPHAERDDPETALELARVSDRLGIVPPGPTATRHLRARLEIDSPRPQERVRTVVPFAEVSGRAGLSRSLLFDVVIAIDQSGTTLAASGTDVDGDGKLGTSRQTIYGELYPSSDPGDEVQAAELVAATRLVEQLHPDSTRVAVIGFGARARVVVPLGPPAEALAALARMQEAELAYRPGGTSLGNALVAASDQFVRHRDPERRRERAIVLLSDGFATWPDPRKGRQHALDVAAELADYGVRIHAYLIGKIAPLNDDTYPRLAELTSGRFVPVPDPADVIARLSQLRLTGLRDISIRNLRTGVPARAVRVRADGSFDALVELAPGTNEVEIVANVTDREPLREVRSLDYAYPETVTDRDREVARAFLGRLQERGIELGAHAQIERERRPGAMERRIEIEMDSAATPAPEVSVPSVP